MAIIKPKSVNKKVLLGALGAILLVGTPWAADQRLKSRSQDRSAAFIGFYQVLRSYESDQNCYPRSIRELKSRKGELFEDIVSRYYGPTFEAEVEYFDPGSVGSTGIIAIERSPSRVGLMKSDRLLLRRDGDIEWENGRSVVKDGVFR